MNSGNCEICGIWDSSLIDGVCSECTAKYSNNVDAARETFKKAFNHPDTRIIKLKRIANLARISMTYTFDEN